MNNIKLRSKILFGTILTLASTAVLSFKCVADPNRAPTSGASSEAGDMLAPTPPMGWNSWNWFGKNKINEDVVRRVIDAMASEGLRDAGYKYVVVDGGWRDTKLGKNGELLANPEKFPHGMKALADYAHSKGLKFGLHTVPGTKDCGGDPVGGYGHEEVQLQQFIDWGLDFIKLDMCRVQGGWNEKLIKDVYQKWSDLIKRSGAKIVLSISAYRFREWNPEVGQMSRTTGDISGIVGGMFGYKAVFDDPIPAKKGEWKPLTVMQIATRNNAWAKYARPGYWNDPDMLVTGDQGLTEEEQRNHFALWCIMSAPLMLGNNPLSMSEAEKKIIMNKECIRIDQDPTEQGTRIQRNGSSEVWAKKLKDGSVAVLLLNRDKKEAKEIAIDFEKVGLHGKASVKKVFTGEKLGSYENSFSSTIQPRSGLFVLMDPQ